MNKHQPTQTELFKSFIKEFETAILCNYCLKNYNTVKLLVKFPGEEFFSFAYLCDYCINDPKIEVK